MKALRRLEDAVFKVERIAVCVLLGVLVFLAFLQVVLRQFAIGFVWADTLIRSLVLAAGFLGAAVAAREERHFGVDAVSRLLPKAAHFWLVQLGRAVGAGASLALAWASLQFVRGEMAGSSAHLMIGSLTIPAGAFESVLPVSFLLMAFHFAMRLADPPREEPALV